MALQCSCVTIQLSAIWPGQASLCHTRRPALSKPNCINPFRYIKNQITSWGDAIVTPGAIPLGDGELRFTAQHGRCLQEQLWTAEPFHGKERPQGGGRTAGPGGDQEFHSGEAEWGCFLGGQVRVLEDGSMRRSGAPGSLLTGPQC